MIGRAAVRRGTQAHDVRRGADGAVVGVASRMVQRDADAQGGPTLSDPALRCRFKTALAPGPWRFGPRNVGLFCRRGASPSRHLTRAGGRAPGSRSGAGCETRRRPAVLGVGNGTWAVSSAIARPRSRTGHPPSGRSGGTHRAQGGVPSRRARLPLPPTSVDDRGALMSPMGASVDAMGARMCPTDASVDVTRASVASTRARMSPTDASVDVTRASVASTGARMSPTDASVEVTRASVASTGARMSPTDASVEVTRASVASTGARIEPDGCIRRGDAGIRRVDACVRRASGTHRGPRPDVRGPVRFSV